MRILILGASGSGTTTLGKAIASKLGCPCFDTDDYFWLPTDPPFRTRRDSAIRLGTILGELSQHDTAVVSGDIMNWGDELEDSFDLIVFVYLDTSIRVERLRVREEQELGYADPEFLEWASEYDTGPSEGRSLAKHRKWLSERRCAILTIEGDLTVEERCGLIVEALPKS
jgi:uridine kinase